jgi:hypothetical protein
MPELEDDQEEYEVEGVKDKALMEGKIRYLVKWAGWPSEYSQWVDEEDMENAQGKIKEFDKRKTKGKVRTTPKTLTNNRLRGRKP